MIICGIDPGYDRAGYGFLEITGNSYQVLSYGLVSTKKELSFQDRLYELGNDFDYLFKTYQPTHLFIEKLFVGKNISTVLPVAEVRGILKYIALQNNISIAEISPNTIKKTVTGYGAADKAQMVRAVTLLLNLSEPPKPDDVADALAIAFCGYLKKS